MTIDLSRCTLKPTTLHIVWIALSVSINICSVYDKRIIYVELLFSQLNFLMMASFKRDVKVLGEVFYLCLAFLSNLIF